MGKFFLPSPIIQFKDYLVFLEDSYRLSFTNEEKNKGFGILKFGSHWNCV